MLSHLPLQAIAYEDGDIGKLLEETAKIGFQEPEDNEEQIAQLQGKLGPGLESIIVRVWNDGKQLDVEPVDEGMTCSYVRVS